MTVKSAPYYWLECDGEDCNRKSTEHSDYAAWADEAQAKDDAREGSDWQVKDGKHYCDQCRPSWCRECDADITAENPRCGDDVWSCASCHTDCGHES